MLSRPFWGEYLKFGSRRAWGLGVAGLLRFLQEALRIRTGLVKRQLRACTFFVAIRVFKVLRWDVLKQVMGYQRIFLKSRVFRISDTGKGLFGSCIRYARFVQ